jgi:hypothetical protein
MERAEEEMALECVVDGARRETKGRLDCHLWKRNRAIGSTDVSVAKRMKGTDEKQRTTYADDEADQRAMTTAALKYTMMIMNQGRY